MPSYWFTLLCLGVADAGFGEREDAAKVLEDRSATHANAHLGNICGAYKMRGKLVTKDGNGIVVNVLTDSTAARGRTAAFLTLLVKLGISSNVAVFAYRADKLDQSEQITWAKAIRSKLSHITVHHYSGARHKHRNLAQQPHAELITALCVSLSHIPFSKSAIHLAFDDETEVLPAARNFQQLLLRQVTPQQPLSLLPQNQNCSTPSDWHDLMVRVLSCLFALQNTFP
jgi:hypothetical protein